MKRPKLQELLLTIFDKKLYGSSFVIKSAFFLGFCLVVPSYAFLLLSWPLLLIYVICFFCFFLFSGLLSKNLLREFHPMDLWLSYLFLITASLALTFSFIMRVEGTLWGFSQLFLIFILSVLALFVLIVQIAVPGQRASLRNSIHLTDGFFEKQRRVWSNELAVFPNATKIVECLDEGKYIAGLFDQGSFNLAVLWSCNIMEKITDAVAEGIISNDSSNVALFKKTDGSRRGYPEQLRNIGYKLNAKNANSKNQITLEQLWHELRNDIAHRNYRPTFEETAVALDALVNFVQEMPKTLQTWR